MKIGKFIALLLVAIISFGSITKTSAQDRDNRYHREVRHDYHRSRSYQGYRHDNVRHYDNDRRNDNGRRYDNRRANGRVEYRRDVEHHEYHR